MCNMLISINPEHVENIFSGAKKYEYRKIKCKNKVDKMIIYSTSPVMKVVGEATIEEILEDTPDKIWSITEKDSGINKKFFDDYFKDKEKAVAYKLTNIVKYNSPKELSSYGVKTAPQSYVYI